MAPLEHVPVPPLSLERFAAVLLKSQFRALQRAIARSREVLAGRVVWCVNSTARGGGVAEMLHSLLGYARDAGVDARWAVIQGDPEFFRVTKRIHNNLHGSPGDSGSLGDDERAVYERALATNAGELRELLRPGDLILLHDPQTAGLVPQLVGSGAHVGWRSHIGQDAPNATALHAWEFLLPYIREAEVCIFSRPAYAWDGVDPSRHAFIAPSIDAFSTKNAHVRPGPLHAILHSAGIVDATVSGAPVFQRADGTPGRVDRRAELTEASRLTLHTPLVLQVSRWDSLKDPLGVIAGFAEHVAPFSEAHLLLAGPATAAVSDDPEGAAVLAEAQAAWAALPDGTRERIHLACLPMDDAEENAAIVNALQRHARVVCQKSLAEGFGLTVSEAMWKGRPVVASRTGGIQDQIVDGESGLLVDPTDLLAFGDAVLHLLADHPRAERMGAEAHRRVRDAFLGPRHLTQYLDLFERLIGAPGAPG